MESQNSVAKRIIWAVSMLILCAFLTFFMSMFIGRAFPSMNIIYKGGIPVLVFVALGVAGFGVQNYLTPYLDDLNFPKALKKALPFLFLIFGLFVGQMYYDQHSKTEVIRELYKDFIQTGEFYQISGWNFASFYQSGLSIVCILLGNTIFAVGVYNKIYLSIIAILIYFALKNITGQRVAGNLFILIFLMGQQTLKCSVLPDVSLVYILFVAVYLFFLSGLYVYRMKGEKNVLQGVLVCLSVVLFALLLWMEPNSIIFALPAIAVFLSGYRTQKKNWYLMSSVLGTLTIILICAGMIIMNPLVLLEYGFDLPDIERIGFDITTLLILNMLGFIGIFAMGKGKIYYIIPALMSVYFVLAKNDFSSGITDDVCTFLCFAMYAVMGIDTLVTLTPDEEENLMETENELSSVPTITSTPVSVETSEGGTSETQNMEEVQNKEEIQNIQALNAKLNQVQAGFVPKTFVKPKRVEKKVPEYGYEPTLEEMKYDIEISDDDDFDI